MGKKYHQKNTEEKMIHWIIIGFMGVGLLSWIWPLLLAGGLGFGIYKLATRQARLEQSQTALKIQDLKDSIGRADRQLRELEGYQTKADHHQYAVLARQLLPQLDRIQEETDHLKARLEPGIYQRISTKVAQERQGITDQLEQLGLAVGDEPLSQEEEQVLSLAPELLVVYRNIRLDDRIIREKIVASSNRAELTALHDANMNRFEDILAGYLKIKQSPKDFYNADERLALAKAALEQFDVQLDKTLQELNETDLADFEISLRLMSQKEADHDL